jgi:hypothetical protein
MTQAPERRARERSAQMNASGRPLPTGPVHQPASDVPKLPLGIEPPPDSPDWAHRCPVDAGRLVPDPSREVRLHVLGLPRPLSRDGWPMPFAGKDPDDPCATERELEVLCARERRCQGCGLHIPVGEAFAVRRPGHRYTSAEGVSVSWVEGRSALHLRCLRFAIRYCPEMIRQLRQGVAKVVREPAAGDYRVLDGLMLDTTNYLPFIEPVWHLEALRDTRADPDAGHRLECAAAANAAATAVLFPQLARRPSR